MKIGVISLAIGDKFKADVKYGILTKQKYCSKHGYDFLTSEGKTDYSRHLAWSKVPAILQYLRPEYGYDYLVWIDADTLIMNDSIRVEDLIQRLMEGKDLMYVAARQWVNTGVLFMRNTPFLTEFLTECWQHTDQICWEQGAIDLLYRTNWKNCQSKIKVVADQTQFNSDWYQYKPGQFILHFPGCGEAGRPVDCLKRMMAKFCPIRMDEDTDETYIERRQWLDGSVGVDVEVWYMLCRACNKYLPLD